MKKFFLVFGIYLVIEIVFRLIISSNHNDLRNLLVLSSYLVFLFYFNYLSLDELSPFLLYIYIILFVCGLCFLNDNSLYVQAALFAPFVEEIICRHVLLIELSKKNVLLAVIITTVFFLLLHFPKSWKQSIFIILCSVILCGIQLKTGKIGYAIVAHGLINYCIIMASKIWNVSGE